MRENVENIGSKPGRAWKLQNIRRHLSNFGHRVCSIVGCSKHSYVPAPSFKRLWKRTRDFIVHIPSEFMFAASTEIHFGVFFTDDEQRFDFFFL
jgi:hypothetical protein